MIVHSCEAARPLIRVLLRLLESYKIAESCCKMLQPCCKMPRLAVKIGNSCLYVMRCLGVHVLANTADNGMRCNRRGCANIVEKQHNRLWNGWKSAERVCMTGLHAQRVHYMT